MNGFPRCCRFDMINYLRKAAAAVARGAFTLLDDSPSPLPETFTSKDILSVSSLLVYVIVQCLPFVNSYLPCSGGSDPGVWSIRSGHSNKLIMDETG